MGKLFPSICHHHHQRPAEYLLQIDILIPWESQRDIFDDILILWDIFDAILIYRDIIDAMCYVLY